MIVIDRNSYTLLLGSNPCEIFHYYGETEMHGLNYKDCILHNNTEKQAYIWGWANYVPKDSKDYQHDDARYVFINLQRCGDNYETFAGVYHEMMHHSLWLHNYNVQMEEEMISWAETEALEVFPLIIKASHSLAESSLHYRN